MDVLATECVMGIGHYVCPYEAEEIVDCARILGSSLGYDWSESPRLCSVRWSGPGHSRPRRDGKRIIIAWGVFVDANIPKGQPNRKLQNSANNQEAAPRLGTIHAYQIIPTSSVIGCAELDGRRLDGRAQFGQSYLHPGGLRPANPFFRRTSQARHACSSIGLVGP